MRIRENADFTHIWRDATVSAKECRNRFGCFFFELSQRRCDQDTDVTVAQDQDLALIQPAPSEYEQLIPIGAAGHLIAQGAYQGATLVLRHPMKPQDITGQLLMVKEGSTANILAACTNLKANHKGICF